MNKSITRSLYQNRHWCCITTAVMALIVAFSIENIMLVSPCILCQLQRAIFTILIVTWLIQNLLYRYKFIRIILDGILFFFLLFGLFVAFKHSWMQFHPETVSHLNCPSNLWLTLRVYPFPYSIIKILDGGAQCAQIDISFLTLPLPFWVFQVFLLLIITHIYTILSRK